MDVLLVPADLPAEVDQDEAVPCKDLEENAVLDTKALETPKQRHCLRHKSIGDTQAKALS